MTVPIQNTQAPNCFLCGNPSQRAVTCQFNQNGNAGRPYYKCVRCDKFLVFADEQGNHPLNPVCFCGSSSKAQLNGRNRSPAGGLHFVCRLGTCNFFVRGVRNGRQVVVREDLTDFLANLSIT